MAGIKWALVNEPRLAAQAALLAHTERAALALEVVEPSLPDAVAAYVSTITASRQRAVFEMVLADLYLAAGNHEQGRSHFERAAEQWEEQQHFLSACYARLRAAGACLLKADQAAAAALAQMAQTCFARSLPLNPSIHDGAEAVFYWFNMVYNPLLRWVGLPETDLQALVEMAQRSEHVPLIARASHLYHSWCLAKEVPRPPEIREKGRQLVLQTYRLWRAAKRRDRADDAISFARYRLKNRYNRRIARRFACRRSAATPELENAGRQSLRPSQPAAYWWLGASEVQRQDWLSFMLPRYLGTLDRPFHPKTRKQLSKLTPGSRAYQWVETFLEIGMLGRAGRRPLLKDGRPQGHLLNGPEWRVLSGQRPAEVRNLQIVAMVEACLVEFELQLTG
jgi:hypothetical protein